MSDSVDFPLPADASDEERATASREIGVRTSIVEQRPDRIRFDGRLLGQTGPIWHFQYLRVYQVPHGFLAAGHDLREPNGIVVVHSDRLESLSAGFAEAGVREFIDDELRFRGHLKEGHAAAH